MKRWLGIGVDGWPLLLGTGIGGLVCILYTAYPLASLPLFLLAILVALKFRDPDIPVRADPNGVLSPVSGRIKAVSHHGNELRILIQVRWFGPYALRSPIEGTVQESERHHRGHGVLIRKDEGHDVYLRLFGPRWFAPISSLQFGRRVGQGQRSGALRFAVAAEVVLPPHSRLLVEEGDRVMAATTVLAELTGSGEVSATAA